MILPQALAALHELSTLAVRIDAIERQYGAHPLIDSARAQHAQTKRRVHALLAALMTNNDVETTH
jgi:hypothetical protein